VERNRALTLKERVHGGGFGTSRL